MYTVLEKKKKAPNYNSSFALKKKSVTSVITGRVGVKNVQDVMVGLWDGQ